MAFLTLAGCQAKRVRHTPVPYPEKQNVALRPELATAARQEIARQLQAPDPETRAHAIEAVSMTGSADLGAEVIRGLGDREPMVRYAAALAAGQLRLADAKPALLNIAEERDEKVRVVVRFALHRLGDTHLSHQLEKMSQDPDPTVRGTVAMVLGLLGEPSGLKVLSPLRRDPNPVVRQQASESMWRLHDEEGLQDLIALSLSKYPDDEMLGLLGLAAPRDTRVRQHVRNGLTADWPEVSLVAARGMGMLGSDEGYGIALQGAHNGDKRQRLLAALAFGDIGRPDSQDELGKLLHDADPAVRIAAATAVLELNAVKT
jgi:HEAT repeat protein